MAYENAFDTNLASMPLAMLSGKFNQNWYPQGTPLSDIAGIVRKREADAEAKKKEEETLQKMSDLYQQPFTLRQRGIDKNYESLMARKTTLEKRLSELKSELEMTRTIVSKYTPAATDRAYKAVMPSFPTYDAPPPPEYPGIEVNK